ncbi:peptidase inhibitor family I36 protein [Streptomyces sp. NPDC055239]
MRTRSFVIGTAATAMAGVLAVAPTASAEPSPPSCPKGYVCVWNGESTAGPTAFKTQGNWHGSHTFRDRNGLVFNNGVAYPGADHIQVTWTYGGSTGSKCLHYNPGPGDYQNVFSAGATLTSLVWRGEC